MAPLEFLLVCLLLITANQLIKAEQKATLKPEDWQPIHYQVYGSGGHYVEPEITLELLKQLNRIYEPFSDEETNGRKSKVAQLVEASELKGEKCTRAYLAQLQTIQNYNSPFRHTLIPYIGHAIRLYLDMCEVKLLHNLHNQVAALEVELKGDMLALVNATQEVKYGGYSVSERGHLSGIWLHFGHLIEGILEYLEHKLGAPRMREIRKMSHGGAYFESLFQVHVMDVCGAWMRIVDPIEAFHENDLRLKYNEEESQWISYGHFCHFIERHRTMIGKKAYRQFKRRTSSFPKLCLETHRHLRKFNCFDPFA